ncbi:hypothetical protein QE152_g29377 [Popillia japonica]|uniref:Uncharacterized protein n=1 Tax=Popillia japonica TaxID=7064 RepID=A0AAW1JHV6_POPJA
MMKKIPSFLSRRLKLSELRAEIADIQDLSKKINGEELSTEELIAWAAGKDDTEILLTDGDIINNIEVALKKDEGSSSTEDEVHSNVVKHSEVISIIF